MANREKVIKDILSYNKLAQTCTNLHKLATNLHMLQVCAINELYEGVIVRSEQMI